jgi:AraC-like DNA-binding protein
MSKPVTSIKELEIPIELPPPPFSPWLRLGVIDAGERLPCTDVRFIESFTFTLQLECSSWMWLEALGGCLDVEPGDLIFLPPNFVHSWRYDGSERHVSAHFDLHANPDLEPFYDIHVLRTHVRYRPASRNPIFRLCCLGGSLHGALRIPMITRVRNPEEWRERLETLVRIHQNRDQLSLEAQFVIEETVMWGLTTLHRENTAVAVFDAHVDPVVSTALNDIKDPSIRKDMQRLTVQQIAERYGKSLSAFSRAFRKATGTSMHQYLVERQMEQAAHLLVAGNDKIGDIARAIGFDDQYHFSRLFHKVMGVPPSEYRARARGAKSI